MARKNATCLNAREGATTITNSIGWKKIQPVKYSRIELKRITFIISVLRGFNIVRSSLINLLMFAKDEAWPTFLCICSFTQWHSAFWQVVAFGQIEYIFKVVFHTFTCMNWIRMKSQRHESEFSFEKREYDFTSLYLMYCVDVVLWFVLYVVHWCNLQHLQLKLTVTYLDFYLINVFHFPVYLIEWTGRCFSAAPSGVSIANLSRQGWSLLHTCLLYTSPSPRD